MVEARHLCSFAAHQRHPRLRATLRDSLYDRDCEALIEFAAADVVEEKEWPRVVADDVVHAHRDAIDADRMVAAGRERNLQFRADPVSACDQHRRAHFTRAVKPDNRAESSNSLEHVRALGRGRQPAEKRDEPLLEVDVDARSNSGVHSPLSQFPRLAKAIARQARLPFG